MSPEPFDLSKVPMRWSALSAFEYNPEQWFNQYVLGRPNVSKQMTFGSLIDQRIQDDPTFMPDLPRFPLMQHRMEAKFGKLKVQGTADGIDLDVPQLIDYKTGAREWTQKRCDEHGQLKMYLLLLWLTEKIRPEEFVCRIYWLPTQENWKTNEMELISETRFETFETRHDMQAILEFGVRIHRVRAEMQAYLEAKMAAGELSPAYR